MRNFEFMADLTSADRIWLQGLVSALRERESAFFEKLDDVSVALTKGTMTKDDALDRQEKLFFGKASFYRCEECNRALCDVDGQSIATVEDASTARRSIDRRNQDRIEKIILADEDGDIIRPIDSFAIVHPCNGCKKDFPVPQTEPDEDDIELEEEKNPCYHCTRLCKSWGEALHHICNNWNRDGRRKVYAIVDGEAHLVSEA